MHSKRRRNLGEKMKSFFCKKCGFSGIRQVVREHIKQEHLVIGKKSGKTRFNIKNESSPMTNLMESKDEKL